MSSSARLPARSLLALSLIAAMGAVSAQEMAQPAPANASVNATDAAQAGNGTTSKDLDTISVIGRGETRQVQRITAKDMKTLPPGTSPLKVLEKLPGVHFESADSYGNYEWSTRISLRGFNQTRLGFMLDDIPLGDMSYGNNNGLHISRALISENLGSAELSSGIGALGTASTGNLGGTVQFHSSDPAPDYGVMLAQTIGSDSTYRTYGRLDTGDHHGFAMYLSAESASADKWKGDGQQKQFQFNGKAVYNFGDSKVGALFTTSKRNETDYQDLSWDMLKRLGWNWDNYAPNWNAAVNAAKTQCGATYVYTCDDAYYAGRGLRNDSVTSLFGDFALAEGVRLKATAYHHENRGQGHWFTPYQASYPGTAQETPISIRTTEYGINRSGLMAGLEWTLGNNLLQAGAWGENSHHTVQRNFYFISGPVDDSYFLHNPNIRKFYQRYATQTRQFYLQDSITLLDGRMRFDIGVKSPHTTTTSTTVLGSYANGSLRASKGALPQLGFGYKFDDRNEVFASYAQNIAAFQAGINGPLATTQAAFDVFASKLKPEESSTIEAGYRHGGDWFEGSLALYTTKFKNRLLSIQQCSSGIQGCPSAYANVGAVNSRGAEATFILKPMQGLRWYNSLSYNKSTYADDYLNGATLVPTKGKTTVDSPKLLFNSELAWTMNGWDARVAGSYTGKRYYTYLNDGAVPSYWQFNASAGYDFGKMGFLQDLRVALNVTNLANKHYFGTIGSNGFTDSDAVGYFATMQAGAPRQAMFTATAKF
ncbi:TonB-dependent receptor [Solilutibacter silvestris]|uniref:TonB dependent receptor n=1 Tax=Solilutibacter silvestris TaxID=1645665 RepID=A0A2K1PZ29_9GAMM|nr:TonB-dependent receptor [Lysobacter silvestris]PNS08048.1 TonB dependent receptor [Lysobacter silvestris]